MEEDGRSGQNKVVLAGTYLFVVMKCSWAFHLEHTTSQFEHQ